MSMKEEKYIQSINLNSDTDFPYLVLEVDDDKSYPLNPGFQVMHWHEDLQFIYVYKQSIEVIILDNVIEVKEQEGIFINKNVVHHIKGMKDAHYKSFLFPSYFLSFYLGSPAKSQVDKIVDNKQFALFHFQRNVKWCEDILNKLESLAALEYNKTETYVYEVLVLLCSIYLQMIKNIDLPLIQLNDTKNIRMQNMLRYIEQHYHEDLTLEDLSKSAQISKSECSRCFKLSVHMSPFQYLNEYRLLKAAELLAHTDEQIGSIAGSVGYHQVSHFGKCFKEKTGYSPRQYRQIKKYQSK